MGIRPSVFMGRVRAARPLVHHITNYVTVNDCANVCICAGGSPVMTDGEDVADMVAISSATVVNIGTLNARTVASYRTEVAERLMGMHPTVIKGNAGEIGVLSGLGGDVKGVDSHGSSDVASAVETLARATGSIVVATGETDYVSDGSVTYRLENGTDMLGNVSGTGCMVSSVVGCYIGACGRSIEAVASAVTAFNIAAEVAVTRCGGPGTFRPALLDAMFNLDGETLDDRARCERA